MVSEIKVKNKVKWETHKSEREVLGGATKKKGKRKAADTNCNIWDPNHVALLLRAPPLIIFFVFFFLPFDFLV